LVTLLDGGSGPHNNDSDTSGLPLTIPAKGPVDLKIELENNGG